MLRKIKHCMHTCDTPHRNDANMGSHWHMATWGMKVMAWAIIQWQCQHIQTCNSNWWICLASQHGVVLDPVSKVWAIHNGWIKITTVWYVRLWYLCFGEMLLKNKYWWLIYVYNIWHSMNMNKLTHSFTKGLNWQTIHETREQKLRASIFEFVYPVNIAPIQVKQL